MSVPFLGSIPIDPEICRDSDNGVPFIVEHADSPAANAFAEIVKKVEHFLEQNERSGRITKPSLLERRAKK
jgi:MinD-like ATPase involved in chromosome partitioning or flagellar assembly